MVEDSHTPPTPRYKFPKDENHFLRNGSEAKEESCEVKGCTVLCERAAVEIKLIRLTREMRRQGKAGGYDPLNTSIVAANNTETY